MDTVQFAMTNLLIVADSNQSANRLVSQMRQERLTVRAANVESEQAFSHSLTQEQWDVLVCFDNGKLSLDSVFALHKKHNQDFPILLVTTTDVQLDRFALYRFGVYDVVAAEQLPALSLSVLRAVEHHQTQRQIRAQAKLYAELEQRHQALLNVSTLPISYVLDGLHLYCNHEYAKFFGYDNVAAIQSRPFLNLVAASERNQLKNLLREEHLSVRETELRLLGADGLEFAGQLTLVPVNYQGHACLQATFTVGADDYSFSEEIALLSNQDLTSKAANRQHFLQLVDSALAEAVQGRSTSTLVTIRLRYFNELTPVIGEANCHLLLQKLTQQLQQYSSTPEAVGRLDDDLFALLLPYSEIERAQKLAALIKEQVLALIRAQVPPSVTSEVVVGLATIDRHCHDAASLIQQAQQRPGLEVPDEKIRKAAAKQSDTGAMLDYLTLALRENRFILNFQPLVPIEESTTPGYSVLIRMLDKHGAEQAPGTFLPLALANELGESIDRCVINLLLNSADAASGQDLLFIHLTSTTLASWTFLPWLQEQVAEKNFAQNRLVFSISEIDLYQNYENALSFCHTAAEHKLSVAISHFGSAIDPFAIFKHFQPGYVALDETLIRDLATNPQRKEQIAALIAALQAQSIKVAVPQIDSVELLPVLWSIGADFVQGYSLQPPIKSMNYGFVQEEEITALAPNQN